MTLSPRSELEGVALGVAIDALVRSGDAWKLDPSMSPPEFESERWERAVPLTHVDVVDGIVRAGTFWEQCRVDGVDLIGASFAELRSIVGEPWIVDTVEPLVLEHSDWCEVRVDDGVVRRVTISDFSEIVDER